MRYLRCFGKRRTQALPRAVDADLSELLPLLAAYDFGSALKAITMRGSSLSCGST
jgi:hypothetical protein